MPDSKPVIAITGASSGIGRAAAGLFAQKGWNVGLIARSEPGLEATRADVERAGGRGCVAPADVADSAALERAATLIEAELGPIDAWVNVAGISSYGLFLDIPEEEYQRVTQVTYMGVVNGTRTALQRMMTRDRGCIINIGSAITLRAAPLQSSYSAAKHAVGGFTEAIRAELIHERSNVHLGIVFPPSTNTPFFNHSASHLRDGVPRPPPPIYQPEIVADAIHLAVTERRRSVKVGGQTVMFGVLNTIAPGLLDWGLGMTGFATQTSKSSKVAAQREVTTFQPSSRPSPVHGPFDSEALSHSMQMAVNRSPGLGLLLLGAGALTVMALMQGRPSRR